MHQRTKIRNRVIEILKGNTLAFDRVFENRSRPLSDTKEIPAIAIYPRSETIEEYAHSPRELKRTLILSIECFAIDTVKACAEDILDEMGFEIEQLLARDDSLGRDDKKCHIAEDSILNGVEFDYAHEGAARIGTMRLFYAITYITAVPIDNTGRGYKDLKSIGADWDLAVPDDTIEAKDKLDLPT